MCRNAQNSRFIFKMREVGIFMTTWNMSSTDLWNKIRRLDWRPGPNSKLLRECRHLFVYICRDLCIGDAVRSKRALSINLLVSIKFNWMWPLKHLIPKTITVWTAANRKVDMDKPQKIFCCRRLLFVLMQLITCFGELRQKRDGMSSTATWCSER